MSTVGSCCQQQKNKQAQQRQPQSKNKANQRHNDCCQVKRVQAHVAAGAVATHGRNEEKANGHVSCHIERMEIVGKESVQWGRV